MGSAVSQFRTFCGSFSSAFFNASNACCGFSHSEYSAATL